MRVFLSVDMEGIAGLVRWADVITAGQDYPRNRRLMTLETNAAIDGAFEGGASEVVVEENHGVEDLCNLLMDEIDPRCRVVRGAGRPTATTMAALDATIGVMLLVGHHARAGSFPGIMAHTVSYDGFASVRLNGAECGEPEIFTIRAGELGVPLGLICGDQVVIEQVRKRTPQVEAVEVKRALANQAADVIPPERARESVREGARRAVQRAIAGDLPVYRDEPAPYEIEVELRKPAADGLRQNLAQMDGMELAEDERTVRISAPDMDLGFRRIAYLTYGTAAGLTRY